MRNEYKKLRWLSRRCYKRKALHQQENNMKLTVSEPEMKVLLSFPCKPPKEIRREIRLYNFKWSRKQGCWHGWLNREKLKQVEKIYGQLSRDG